MPGWLRAASPNQIQRSPDAIRFTSRMADSRSAPHLIRLSSSVNRTSISRAHLKNAAGNLLALFERLFIALARRISPRYGFARAPRSAQKYRRILLDAIFEMSSSHATWAQRENVSQS